MSVETSTDVSAERLSATSARELTDRIRATLHTGHKLLLAAHTGEAHVALGYPRSADGWAAYCETEFAEARMLRIDAQTRREIAAPMREAEMTYRAIGSALGVDAKTIRNDLRPTGESSPVAQPEMVTSLDGRRRPASRSTTPPAPAGPPREDVLAARVDDSALRLARWRRAFAQAISRAGEPLRFDADDVRDQSDPEVLAAYAGLVEDLAAHLAKATAGPRLRTINPTEDR